MQELRIVLIILGAVVIVALFLHGLWSTKKEKPSRFGEKNVNASHGMDQISGFDKDGLGSVRVIRNGQDGINDKDERKEPTLFEDAATDPLFSVEKDEPLPSIHSSLKDLSKSSEPESETVKTPPREFDQSTFFETQEEELQVVPELDDSSQLVGNARIKEPSLTIEKPKPKIYRKTSPIFEGVALDEPNLDALNMSVNPIPEMEPFARGDATQFSASPINKKDVVSEDIQLSSLNTPSLETSVFQQAESLSNPIKTKESELKIQVPEQILPEAEDSDAKSEITNSPKTDVIMISVQMRNNQEFKGRELINCLEQFGMLFGEMDIFHRHADLAGTGKVLFSAANMFNPGSFPMDNIQYFTTQGLTFFMTLPCYGEAEQNFKLMLQTAQQVADLMGGDVTDQEHNLISPQSIDAYKKRIKRFYLD